MRGKTTFEPTLSGVPHRQLQTIPRLDRDGVEQILGRSAVAGAEVAIKQHVKDEIEKRGHPLFWSEYKSVQLFKVLFDQFDITHIWDVTPGSGAAASAALATGTQYEGFTANAAHKQWIEAIMDRAIFALAIESDETTAAVGATKEHVAIIRLFSIQPSRRPSAISTRKRRPRRTRMTMARATRKSPAMAMTE